MIKITELDLTALYDLADECIKMYHDEITKINAVGYNRGLLNSTANYRQVDDDTIAMTFILPDYYVFVEEGRRPTVKSEDPERVYNEILKWVRAKGIVGKAKNGKKPPTQEQIAWGIYRKVVGFAKDANNKDKLYGVGYYGRDSHGKHPLENTLKRMEAANMRQRMADIVAEKLNGEIHAELLDMADYRKR